MKRFRRWRTRVRNILAPLSGWKVYLVALVLALPDILDGLGAVDLSAFFPPAVGAKVALLLTLLRLVLGSYLRTLAAARRPDQEPR